MNPASGTLYVVATPIGNVSDMSDRARATLAQVDLVLAEDTRHTGTLLKRLGISARMASLHEHNEAQRAEGLVQRLLAGEQMALVSDAGTPLVSDPGYRLTRAAREAGVRMVPVPGPSAVLSALSVAGLPTDRFVFEGFVPARAGARKSFFEGVAREPRTLVFFEAGRRLTGSLEAMAEVFGSDREATVAREMTKAYESIRHGTLGQLGDWTAQDPQASRGELAVVVAGFAAGPQDRARQLHATEVLIACLEVLPTKPAAALTARLTGASRNALYREALALKQDD